jgi:hypothetical protein
MTGTFVGAATESVVVKAFLEYDGQGAPSYDTEIVVELRVAEPPDAQRYEQRYAIARDGSSVRIDLVLYVPPEVTTVPGLQDKVTARGESYVVFDARAVESLNGTLHHTKVRLQREGA